MVRIEVGSGCENQNATKRANHDDRQNGLKALIEKGTDADFLREMIEVYLEPLMEMEVEGLTGAAHGERR